MCIIEDIFLYDKDSGAVWKKYKDNYKPLKILAKDLRSDKVAENIDKCIDNIVSAVLSLKDELKTVENIKEHIKAYLIETESNNNELKGVI